MKKTTLRQSATEMVATLILSRFGTAEAFSRATGVHTRMAQRWVRGECLDFEALERVAAAAGKTVEIRMRP